MHLHLPLLSLTLTLLLFALPLAKGQQLEQCREPTTELVYCLMSLSQKRSSSPFSLKETPVKIRHEKYAQDATAVRRWEVACSSPHLHRRRFGDTLRFRAMTCLGRGNLDAFKTYEMARIRSRSRSPLCSQGAQPIFPLRKKLQVGAGCEAHSRKLSLLHLCRLPYI